MLILVVWIVNFAISFWNAYVVGKAWVETKHAGGWPQVIAWMGAIMSASGFSWCYLILLVFAAHSFQLVGTDGLQAALSLGYLILIPGILFSGLMITLDSWARAYRSKSLLDLGAAGWNTYAQIHNTYQAIQGFGGAFKNVTKFLSEEDDSSTGNKARAILVVIALVAVALLAGILTTVLIIKKYAATEPLPDFVRQQVSGDGLAKS